MWWTGRALLRLGDAGCLAHLAAKLVTSHLVFTLSHDLTYQAAVHHIALQTPPERAVTDGFPAHPGMPLPLAPPFQLSVQEGVVCWDLLNHSSTLMSTIVHSLIQSGQPAQAGAVLERKGDGVEIQVSG